MKTVPPDRARRAGLAASLGCATAAALLAFACTDVSSGASKPGNTLVNDTMEDAYARYTQDGGEDAYPPQGIPDGGDGSTYDASSDAAYGSVGYEDVQSPALACQGCNCSSQVAYCLENGSDLTYNGPVVQGFCSLSNLPSPAVGCNALPAACTASPSCACILDALQPPLPCYPECTSSGGYFDVFCPTP